MLMMVCEGSTASSCGLAGTVMGLVSPDCSSLRSERERLVGIRSEEHTSELQSLMRISYAVFCLKKKKTYRTQQTSLTRQQATLLEHMSTLHHVTHNQQQVKRNDTGGHNQIPRND